MTDRGADSRLFEEIIQELLHNGLSVRFQARGASMSPAIRDGEIVEVTPVIVSKLRKDDIVLAKSKYGFRLHRIVLADSQRDLFLTRGDCGQENDPALSGSQILGLARAKEVRVGQKVVQANFRTVGGLALRTAARAQAIASKLSGNSLFSTGKRALIRAGILGLLLLLISFFASAQVAVDSRNSSGREFTGAGTVTLNFNQTTTTTANRLLIVGVSMNIANAPATAVSGVTYNGAALTLIGAHNDAGNTRRIEQWYLLNPASGTNPIVVSVQIPTAGAVVGIVAGSTTFTGVDQTVPLGSFVSSDGTGICDTSVTFGCASEYVPSVVNGMILDTLATGGTQNVTVSGPQVSQWNVSTNNGGVRTDPPDVTAVGSSRTGAPSVPISELFSGTSNWSLGAVSINPSTADIAVTTSVSAVPLGQNSTYNITITNNGPSAANNVRLTDTYANTGLAVVSVTPSAGTTCVTGATITCTLPTPFASGAVATVSIVVSTTTAGFYPNTATITDSGTPPDPNTGNNTYVALAPVVSVVCSGTTLTAGGTISGTVNTYYPGNGNVAAGATTIPVGAVRGTGAIAAGSLLLVIQMQDASINTSNTVAYGNGSTGAGFTAINNAGNYEFVKATSAVAGGNVSISGAGSGGGLVFGYTNAAATATKGISTFQVVLVPQYTTATLGALTALPWNGRTGGIIAVDVAGQLNLGSATVSVDGMGFRGGAGLQLNGNFGGANTDYQFQAPNNYNGAVENGVDAPKGEGVAGTSKFVESGNTFLRTINGVGYPSGTAGTDGSMGRGAPGNAGGGGTDADPTANDENAGGGGGGNGGSGGFGGDSWFSNLSSGGEGGGTFPATIDRVAMGGGGGAGTRNNSDGDNQSSSAAAGGGIIFIRADSFTGTATLTANGASAYNGTLNDAGGGGGAGGTIVILAANGGESGLTLQANGGNGGNAWQGQAYALSQRHGPGGGGGGGVIFVSGTPASMSVAGGANGLTLNPGVPYGATSGNAGTSATTATLGQVTGIQSASLCTPDMTLGKSHVGNFTRGTAASYTIPVSNVSPYGATSGLVTINDTLPLGITPTGASGSGWTCSVSNQTVSCTRSDVLAAASAYPSITLNATVSQSAPATLLNTATVGGGGEANFLNDTATDTANVVSSADLKMTDSASPNPVAAGSNISYAQTVTNNGPSAADNATLVTAIPANTTFVSMTAPSGWSCMTPNTGATGNVICTDVSMAGLTAASFTLVVKVNAGVANGTVITNSAMASSSTADPNSSNNTATATTVVGTTSPNLTVTNVASPNPVQAGSSITYTQVVTNTGTSAALTATFTESTPANTTLVSITPPAGWSCATFPPTCTNASVAGGTSGTFTVIYTVNPATPNGSVITDTVTVNAANQAFGASSAVATDVVAGAAQADLALATAASPNKVWAGNDITYTQTITNNGPAAASGVIFTEATPTNTTFQSVTAPAGWTCTTPAVGGTGTVTCNDPSLASGASANIIVVVNVPASVAPTTITANSSVASSNDPNSSNNSTTVSTSVGSACDLAVTNSGTPSPVAAGATLTYTQTITNNGPGNCTSGTFSEPTPANTTFVSVSVGTTGGGTWSCPNTAPIACSNSNVPPGSVATITAVYTVNAGTAAGTIISDTDTVGAAQDVTSGNNSATVNIPVATAGQADLSVTNSASPNPVNAGSNITYTQTVTNSGPASAAAPVLTETLPANTTFVSLTGPAGWTCTTTAPYKCTDGSAMTANTTANFSFVVTVNTGVAAGSTITQTASVSSTTSDPNPGNNSVTVNTQVAGSADLAITNSASPQGVIAGNAITYTQIVTNNGPSTATTASMTETTPASTTFQSITIPAGWSCTTPAVGAAGTINCTNGTFAPGSSTFTVVLKVTAGTPAGTQISDTASVTSSISDPNLANNSATATDVVALGTQANLVVTNSASPTLVAAGSNVTYTQTISNTGPAATATGMTFTQTTPPNTTFQSITTPGAGWTCTTPSVGGTGTITCTDSNTLGVNASGTFTLKLQVNSSTPSGTNITDTATATVSNIVPGITTNTASSTVVVANPNSADMAITKTGSPNPVTQGAFLTYTLTVNNNGPATATNVTVTDSIPSVMTFFSAVSTQGTCSEANGTVTCLLGPMLSGGTPVTITILTMPNAIGVFRNTAIVKADQNDSVSNNNTAIWDETVVSATAIKLQSFTALVGTDRSGGNRVVLTWKTGGESHNLGFNVYRELNGNRVRMNSSLLAGSALQMTGALPKHSGKTYSWIETSTPVPGTSYWLEDIDVNGTHTMHGPISATASSTSNAAAAPDTRTLRQLAQVQSSSPSAEESYVVETWPHRSTATQAQIDKQFDLAAHPAIKILVQHEGWYRVTQPELVKAGLDSNVDPALLQLYAEAVEQPIEITGATPGPGGFGPAAAINFYGTGMDTPFTGTRVYWLVAGTAPGERIPQSAASSGSNQPPASYTAAVELRQHSTYFAALLTSDENNFFGALVTPTPVDQVLKTPHLNLKSTNLAQLEVVLQGVIVAFPHNVEVAINGVPVGSIIFTGQDKGKLNVTVPPGILRDWTNTVTLTSQNGDYDISLVQSIRITYPHQYVADSDELKFTARAGDEVVVVGFTTAPAVLDITDPDHPVQVATQSDVLNGTIAIALQVPWTTTNPSNPVRHTLLAVGESRVSRAFGVLPNRPSHWHSSQAGADIAMVSAPDFVGTLGPLVRAHEGQGKSSAVIRVTELYDEFNFGERSPFAIRRFLATAKRNWKKPPSYLLLHGRASFDPRNYLGFGNLDLVPTRILPLTTLMTASDDWFSDFNESGMPTIATGRLPVSTADEARTVIGKIVAYEGQSTNGPWTLQSLMVADKDDTESFSQDSLQVQAQLPPGMQATDVFTGTVGVGAAQQDIINGINSGQLLVNYLGHGSEEQWSGSNIFDTSSVAALTNTSQLPVFLIMDCLNGFFQDVNAPSLGVDLLLAPNGGAVAVLASSGLNQPAPQLTLDTLVVQAALSESHPPLGDAIMNAKKQVDDPGVRRTFVLLGDPAMQLKQPSTNSSH